MKASRKFQGENISCGDQVTLFVKLDSKKKITDVGWEGEGCAISQASTSIFSEMIKGKTLAQAQKITGETLMKKMDTQLSPARVKCATLPVHTLKEATD